MWKRLKRWISGRSDDVASSGSAPMLAVTLRNLEIAQKFPQDFPSDSRGLNADEPQVCTSCEAALKRVVITTGGALSDQEVWEAYPLALDGFKCEGCGGVTFPAFVSDDEMTELIETAVAFAQREAFDEAEYSFRRAISSWPGYSLARVNFGSMCLDKIRAEKRGRNREDVIERYAQLAEAQFRKALSCQPEVPSQVKFMLGRLLVRRRQGVEGAALLQEVMQATDVTERVRREARALIAESRAQ